MGERDPTLPPNPTLPYPDTDCRGRRVDGELVMRAYTPTSSDDDTGFFDLVIKVRVQRVCFSRRWPSRCVCLRASQAAYQKVLDEQRACCAAYHCPLHLYM